MKRMSGNAEYTEIENGKEMVAQHETTVDEQIDVNDVATPQDNETASDKEAFETAEQADTPSNYNKEDQPSAYDSPDQTTVSEMEQPNF